MGVLGRIILGLGGIATKYGLQFLRQRRAYRAGIRAARRQARKEQARIRRAATRSRRMPRSGSTRGNINSIRFTVTWSGNITLSQATFQFGIKRFHSLYSRATRSIDNAFLRAYARVAKSPSLKSRLRYIHNVRRTGGKVERISIRNVLRQRT